MTSPGIGNKNKGTLMDASDESSKMRNPNDAFRYTSVFRRSRIFSIFSSNSLKSNGLMM